MRTTLDDWEALAEAGAGGPIEAVPACPGPGDIERLRRRWPAGVVSAAVELRLAREKAAAKFGGAAAASLWADRPGVEMASSLAVAAHKGRRLAAAGAEAVFDVCCGVGGDSAGLAAAGLGVVGVERDKTRAWMAARNGAGGVFGVRWAARRGDASAEALPSGAAFHVDPSRRDGDGRRARGLGEIEPGVAVLAGLARGGRAGVAKLAPGVDADDLRSVEGLQAATLEYVSESGRMTQGLAWFGASAETLGPGPVATRVRALAGSVEADIETLGPGDGPEAGLIEGPERFVYAVDPAVERARLLGVLGGRLGASVLGHPGAGLLTADREIESGWVRGFELVESLVWNRRRVRARLAALGAGLIEVKTRGRAVDPDREQAALRGPGDRPMVVFVRRLGAEVRALICERLNAAVAAG